MKKLNLFEQLEASLSEAAVKNLTVTFDAPSILFKDPENVSKLEAFLNGDSVNKDQSLKDAFRRSAVLDSIGKISVVKGGKISVEVKEEPSRDFISLLERIYVLWVKDTSHLTRHKFRTEIDVIFGKSIALNKIFVITKNPSKIVSKLNAILADDATFIPNVAIDKVEAKTGYVVIHLDSDLNASRYLEIAGDVATFVASECTEFDTKAAEALYRFVRAKIVQDVNIETNLSPAKIERQIQKALLDDKTHEDWQAVGVKNMSMAGYLRDFGYSQEQIKFVLNFIQSGY